MFYGRDSNTELYPLYAPTQPDSQDSEVSEDDSVSECDVSKPIKNAGVHDENNLLLFFNVGCLGYTPETKSPGS